MTELEIERETYRMKCKHHQYGEGVCTAKTGWRGNLHILTGCDGKCRRMRNWDKKHDYHES